MSFSTLGLSDSIADTLATLGYQQPTAIQQRAIPVILSGKDLIAAAQTGTGKTASFVLPILERLKDRPAVRAKRVRALILTPTRELALQVDDNVKRYSQHTTLTSLAMYGGVDSEPQKQQLIDGIDVLVATPGRLLDMAHQRAVHFDELEVLVLDEADRMLDMGFIADINKIIERLPEQRQNLLFSATLSSEVRALAKTSLHHAVEVSISPDSRATPDIEQWLITVDKGNKSSLLSYLIKENQWDQALIFIETKHGAAKLVSQLEKRGIKAEAIHSGRSQAVRTQLMVDFKSGDLAFLVATGIAARGIDIDGLSRVVNYDLPMEVDDYIHRIGRTGRAGASGEAISLVSKDDFRNLCAIESRLGHVIERRDIEEFQAQKIVPVSILDYVPKSQARSARSHSGKSNSKPAASRGKSSSPQRGRNSGSTASSKRGSDPVKGKASPWDKWKGNNTD